MAFAAPELELGLLALWIGLVAGMATMVALLVAYFCRLDWEQEAAAAQQRSRQVNGKLLLGSPGQAVAAAELQLDEKEGLLSPPKE